MRKKRNTKKLYEFKTIFGRQYHVTGNTVIDALENFHKRRNVSDAEKEGDIIHKLIKEKL